MNYARDPFAEMVVSRQPSNQAATLAPGHSGQQLHVSGVFIVVLEIALVLENLLPILVIFVWLPAPARGVGDRLVAAFSVTCILSALVPTPLGLASYFSGGWYGGTPTCTTYQVTSIWCNLSSLALLTYMCVNCHFAVWRLRKIRPSPQYQSSYRSVCSPVTIPAHNDFSCASNILPSSSQQSSGLPGSSHQQHYNQSMPRKGSRTSRHKQDVKRDVSVSTNTFNINHNSINEESDKCIIDQDSELRQQSSALLFQTKNVGNAAQIDEKLSNDSMNSPGKKQNIKRLGNECYVHLDEEFLQHYKDDCTAVHVDQFSNSNKNQNLGSCDSARVNKTFQQLQHSSVTRPALSNTGYMSDYKGIGSGTENSGDGPISIFNRTNGNLEYSLNSGNVVNDRDVHFVTSRGCLCTPSSQSRDYVSLMLFFLFACTLTISSLPVVGLGPRSTHSEKSCRSWLVPIPVSNRERTFYVVFLSFVYICLVLGCSSGISVCLQVSNRMKCERKRKSRLYNEEENVPDIVELSVLDNMKRHYSLTCVVMAGLLTWLPIVMMLTLQKAGVHVSEATLIYSNTATSLPGLLNPLLYSLALPKYRTGYKAILEKCCPKRRNHKSHLVRGAHTESNMADDEASTDTVMDTSVTGHTCIHGRANPNSYNHADINAEEYIDDNDNDDFPDDRELMVDERKRQTPKLSEKTPLQAIFVSGPSAVAFRTVLANRSKSPWQDSFSSSSNDNERLLVSNSDMVDEETGL